MTVAAILRAKGTHVETTRPETTLYTVAWSLKIKGIGALVVVSEDSDHILGIISERDIVRALIEHGEQLLALPVSNPPPRAPSARGRRGQAGRPHQSRGRGQVPAR